MRPLIGLMVAALSVLGSGCVQVRMDTEIAADGSGSTTISYHMSRPVADAISRLASYQAGGPEAIHDYADAMDLRRERIDTVCRATGARLLDHTFVDDPQGRRLSMTLAFPRVEVLSHVFAELDDSPGGERRELRLVRTAQGDYHLTSVAMTSAEAVVDEAMPPAGQWAPEDTHAAMQDLFVLLDHREELDVRITVTVPGEVISSNAMEVSDRTSIWFVNAATTGQPESPDFTPDILFSGEGLEGPASANDPATDR
jgi:hypothetical protein